MNLNFSLFDMQVVEIVDRYDKACVPSTYSNDALAYIQSAKTNKTCIRSLTVSEIPTPVSAGFFNLYFNSPISLTTCGCAKLFCLNDFQVPKKMKSPIYIYYQLDNFYQNHRR